MNNFCFVFSVCIFSFFAHADFVIDLLAVKFCSKQITELLFLLLFISLQLFFVFFFNSFLIICFLPAVLACNLCLICCQELPQWGPNYYHYFHIAYLHLSFVNEYIFFLTSKLRFCFVVVIIIIPDDKNLDVLVLINGFKNKNNSSPTMDIVGLSIPTK